MPFELGLFLGVKHGQQQKALTLILDRERYRYQTFLSDIAGQDIRSHDDQPQKVVAAVRNWLATNLRNRDFPGDKKLNKLLRNLSREWASILHKLGHSFEHLTFVDHLKILNSWLEENASDAGDPASIPA